MSRKKKSMTSSAPLNRREKAAIKLMSIINVWVPVLMCLHLTGTMSTRVSAIATAIPAMALMAGLLLMPELRDPSDKPAVSSASGFATTMFALSSMLLLFSSFYGNAAVPEHLKYIELALLICLIIIFWKISPSYRTSFCHMLVMTLAFAMFSFGVVDNLNIALDTSKPTVISTEIVDMRTGMPRRMGGTVTHAIDIQVGDKMQSYPVDRHIFDTHAIGDTIDLRVYPGAFGIEYYEFTGNDSP